MMSLQNVLGYLKGTRGRLVQTQKSLRARWLAAKDKTLQEEESWRRLCPSVVEARASAGDEGDLEWESMQSRLYYKERGWLLFVGWAQQQLAVQFNRGSLASRVSTRAAAALAASQTPGTVEHALCSAALLGASMAATVAATRATRAAASASRVLANANETETGQWA